MSFDPWRDRKAAVQLLLDARRGGATLREAAAAAGLHVATVCRWLLLSPPLAAALDGAVAAHQAAESEAAEATFREFLASYKARLAAEGRQRPRRPPRRRPSVPCHTSCPECGAGVEVRNAFGWPGPAFWRCSRWPYCPWASWRPRHPQDCPECHGPRYWAHSRKSVSCPGCGRRWSVRITAH